jgi:hypothetical protein
MIQIKHKRILMISGFLVALALGVASVFGTQQLWKTWKARFGTSHPKKTLVFTIDLSQRDKLFEQLTRFAEAHDFRIHIGTTTPAGDTFSITMSRKDVMVWGDNVLSPLEEYDFAFYDEDPTNPASQETIESLHNSLKKFINEIPNVTITEVRKRFVITIDESQREELFAQMRKLADEHSLEFQLSLSSDKTLFHAEIHGEGYHLTSEPVVGSPREISTVFFIDYHKAPTSTSLETVDELSNELKSLLGEIPNVTITETVFN